VVPALALVLVGALGGSGARAAEGTPLKPYVECYKAIAPFTAAGDLNVAQKARLLVDHFVVPGARNVVVQAKGNRQLRRVQGFYGFDARGGAFYVRDQEPERNAHFQVTVNEAFVYLEWTRSATELGDIRVSRKPLPGVSFYVPAAEKGIADPDFRAAVANEVARQLRLEIADPEAAAWARQPAELVRRIGERLAAIDARIDAAIGTFLDPALKVPGDEAKAVLRDLEAVRRAEQEETLALLSAQSLEELERRADVRLATVELEKIRKARDAADARVSKRRAERRELETRLIRLRGPLFSAEIDRLRAVRARLVARERRYREPAKFDSALKPCVLLAKDDYLPRDSLRALLDAAAFAKGELGQPPAEAKPKAAGAP
jgi:hypothetical protein